jgi:NADH-quinone oxidoreductase subunit C
LSSTEPGPEDHQGDQAPPAAEDITDPALAAEVDNPTDANAPSGQEAAPSGGTAAADDSAVTAPGSPGELSSDQTPSQGEERGEASRAESLGDVAGGDAGSPESGTGGVATTEDAEPPPSASPAEGPTESAAEPDQPPPTPSAAVAEGAAVQRATEEKVAQAVAAREAAASATADAEVEPGEVDEARQAMVDTLHRVLGDGVIGSHVMPGVDAWVRVAIQDWRRAVEACRDQLGLVYFCYLSAIDWLPSPYGRSEDPAPADSANETDVGEEASGDTGSDEAATEVGSTQLEHGVAGGETRLQLLARLVSPTSHLGLTLKADLDDDALVAPSLIEVFPGADWHEREAWEMYGIDFTGHPNLIHLYLPSGFEGHPLRKDFPLMAREVKPWPGLVDVEAMPGEGDGA